MGLISRDSSRTYRFLFQHSKIFKMVNIAKMTEVERLDLCYKYFIAGFFFLPVFWICNSFWFWPDAYGQRVSNQQNISQKFKFYIKFSIVGSIVWLTIALSWMSYFQMFRHGFGRDLDWLYLYLPIGV